MKQIINKLLTICKMSQQELLDQLPEYLERYYPKESIYITQKYIYVKGDIPVLLVAHMDTVHLTTPENIWISSDQTKIKSDEGIGGDDRCGIYALNYIATKPIKPHLLYTTDEEIGAIGAQEFCADYEDIDVNCIIELDRRGDKDVVVYDDDNTNLYKKFEKLGFTLANGSFTDISYISPHFKISGVNLSIGYYNAHTCNEYIDINVLKENIDILYKFLENPKNYRKKYTYKEKQVKNIFNRYRYLYRDNKCDCCGSYINDFDEEFITDDGIFCESCFNRYLNDYMICPHCNEIVYKAEKCEYCGSKLKEDEYV